MRALLTVVHRYLGLLTAVFLLVTGLTGAVISWDHELDEVLNPHLIKSESDGPARDPVEFVDDIELRYPRVQVTYFEVSEPGHSLYYWVEPRVNPETGRLHDPGFNQVYVDPASGEILGTREWGAFWPITSENFVSFLYKLHFSLHIPEFRGTDHWGLWLLGVIALIWTIDCFVGFCLTLPRRPRERMPVEEIVDEKPAPLSHSFRQRWKPAWKIRWSGGSNKLNFDLHRAVSLWVWPLLFVIAFTAFSLNLYREVFFPLMSMVSDVTPTPIDKREPAAANNPVEPSIGYRQAIDRARAAADGKGWDKPVGSLWYARYFGVYRVEFFTPEESHGTGGVGHKAVFLDAADGRLLGDWVPWRGTAADIFVQAQFPLHSGRILGLPGRILISVMGLVVAMLSVTGIVIWWKKLQARRRSRLLRQRSKPLVPELIMDN